MPDIRIHRAHHLGLPRARQIAWDWAEQVERDFDLACSVLEGDGSDTVEFQRTGVSGRLIVAADHFDLEARLGFLLGAFSKTIEAEITKNLDALLAGAARPGAPRGKSDGPVGGKAGKTGKTGKTAKAGKAPPAAR
ncbi:MAG: polyhydroxyalkanoic acid system family protein [Burkholderiales bacterium]|nr:polyhydroxyalkanoic acid system family protein [Burkholderiales bacterium]MDE2276252.1 polyhydroxyalkanoic acid system family protein [Burkholderiales bacterium]